MSKKKLEEDWLMLMQGMETVARRFFKNKNVEIQDSHIVIYKDWSIITHFINNDYLEVTLSFECQPCLTVKHLKSYHATTCAVLEFIQNNIES